MIWKIAKKEILMNLMTFKFAVGTIVCVVLTAFFVPILAKDYQQRLKNYNTNVAVNEEELGKVKVYMTIKPTAYRPPNALSVFSEGLDKKLGQSSKIEPGGVPEINTASAVGNPFLSAFPTLDVMLVLRVVMSVLAILVAYDTISGEREQGTLKLILSCKLARYQVLLGKLLAGLVTLIVPVTSAFIVGLIILQFFPMVSLAGTDWVRIVLMYLVSLIFIAAMYNVGLLFSCLMHRAKISLVFGLFVWVVLVVVIPNISVYLTRYSRPAEDREKLDAGVRTLIQQRDEEIENLTKTLKKGGNWSGADGAFGGFIVLYCDQLYRRDLQKQYARSEPVKIRYADKIYDAQQQYLAGLKKQKFLVAVVTRISPVTQYESLMSALAGTDLGSYQYFRGKVKNYTNMIIEYIRSKTENFSSILYFTPTKEEDHQLFVQASNNVFKDGFSKDKYEKFDKFCKDKLKQSPTLDLGDLPRFTCGHGSLSSILQSSVSQILSLLFINAFFLALSFTAFLKYDVR